MSSSFSRQFMEKHPKARFSRTCNLLSRYVKEKGSLRDLNLEIDGKIESLESIVRTKDRIDKGKSVLRAEENQPPVADNTVGDFSRERASSSSSSSLSKLEPAKSDTAKKSQLTIFYGGRILVFDEFPIDKVREVVALAKKGSSKMSYGISTNVVSSSEKLIGVVVASSPPSCVGLPPRPQALRAASASTFEQRTSLHGSRGDASGSDLPIARRSSLHRFLGKRKDRAAARGPYHQVQEDPSSSSNSKGDDEHLELKL